MKVSELKKDLENFKDDDLVMLEIKATVPMLGNLQQQTEVSGVAAYQDAQGNAIAMMIANINVNINF